MQLLRHVKSPATFVHTTEVEMPLGFTTFDCPPKGGQV